MTFFFNFIDFKKMRKKVKAIADILNIDKCYHYRKNILHFLKHLVLCK